MVRHMFAGDSKALSKSTCGKIIRLDHEDLREDFLTVGLPKKAAVRPTQ